MSNRLQSVADPKSQPTLWIIAGVNGAGKTTFYQQRLSKQISAEFVNADVMERERWPNEVGKHSLEAQKLAEDRRRELMQQRKSFIAETVFSHPSKVDLVRDAKAAGYRVELIHINVRNAELAIKRIDRRVERGGHDVPDDTVRGRYPRSLAMIKQAMAIADRTRVFDNSAFGKPHQYVMTIEQGRVTKAGENLPQWAREEFKQELSHISPARQNPAAASFADAKAIVQKLAGADANLRIAKPNTAYRGPVVGETSEHILQQQKGDPKVFVAHFKGRLDHMPRLDQDVDITYSARPAAPARVTAPAQQRDTLPGLSVVDVKTAQRYVDIIKTLQLDLQEKMNNGRGGGTPKGRLSVVDRAFLVETTEKYANAAKTHDDKFSPHHQVALHVAGSLAALDHPKEANPFKNQALAQIYTREQQHQAFLDKQMSQAPAKESSQEIER